MTSTGFYNKALTQFNEEARHQYPKPEDQTLLKEFMSERSNPRDAQNAAKELRRTANQKYGSDDNISPPQWIDNVMGNIESVIKFGNYAVGGTAGPEGLAWTAVKIVLGAIQSNYNLYALFGTGLTDVCQVMLFVTHYDRLYQPEINPGWKPNEMVQNLFDTVEKIYIAVFAFSFSIKRHLAGGMDARLCHAFKDFFGAEKTKFQNQLDTIAALRQKILEGSEAVFQEKTLQDFQQIHADIGSTIMSIRGLETQLGEIADLQKSQNESLQRSVKELISMTTERSPWGKALKTFEKYTKDLKPLERTAEPLIAALGKWFKGTCEWLFCDPVYDRWGQFTGNRSGKSVVLATVHDRLKRHYDGSDTVALYVSCETIGFNPSENTQKASRIITNTILHQLYRLAVDEHKNTELLKACNQIFENPKKSKKGSQSAAGVTKSQPEGVKKSLPDFSDAFPELAKQLKKNVIVAIDAVNLLRDSDQETLFDDLRNTFGPKSQHRALVGCRSSTRFHTKILGASESCAYIDIGGDSNRADKELVLSSALRAIPGLTEHEQKQAQEAIMRKAGHRFDYIIDIAIPFMKEPFQRPLSNRLDILPRGMGDTYTKALNKMSQNYISLLRKALLWTCLSPTPPSIEEIMDDYHGTYNQESTELKENDVDSQGNYSFPIASQLEIEQLRTASGPFLSIDSSRFVKLQDPGPIQDFFFHSEQSNKQSLDQSTVCPRCGSHAAGAKTLSEDHMLSMSKKDGHLELALISLRHLNHPKFQRRSGFIAENREKDKEALSNDQEEPKRENDIATKIDSEVANLDEIGDTKELIVKDELKNPEGDDSGLKDGYESERSEDDARPDFPQAYDDSKYGAGDQDSTDSTRTVRHESKHWQYHLRLAEALWPVEERVGNATWNTIMDELDRFVYTNRAAFDHWQKTVGYASPLGPLHIASIRGNLCWVKQLLDHNEKPDELFEDCNAVQRAAFTSDRNMEILRLLLERIGPDCDINTETEGMFSPFHVWVQCDPSIDSVRDLLELGGDPTRANKYKWNSFHSFALSGEDPEAFNLLFQHAGNEAEKCINLADVDGWTPLHILLCRRQPPLNLLKAFLDKGADVNAEDSHSGRPLQCASLWGMVECLKILLPKVKEIDDPDDDGDTALHQAALGGHTESIKFLAENRAGVNLTNHRDRTALHHAAAGCFFESVKFLLNWPGTNINTCDKSKRTPLFLACSGYSPETACLILDKLVECHLPLAEINQLSTRGRTPLSQSCARAFEEVVMKLVQYAKERDEVSGLFVNQVDAKSGLTPLHHAASRGSVACVQELLAINADVATKDKKGRTPLRIACEYWTRHNKVPGYEEVISILINKDREGAVSDNDLVAICAAHGSIQLLQQLQSLNVDLSKADRYGWTPLNLARKYRHIAVERLLKRQAAWAGLLPSRWVSDNAKVAISGNGLQISYKADTTSYSSQPFSISAEKPLPAGLDAYYFEVSVKKLEAENENPLMAIGFCTLDGASIQYPGWGATSAPSAVSWGYHSDDGSLRHGTENDADPKMNTDWKYKSGDTVGCGVDYNKEEIWFTKNGKRIEYSFSKVQGRLFPVLGLVDSVELETKFAGNFQYQHEETKEDVKEETGEILGI
ncbi:hypothetical protein NUW58_g7020 [Xylaria curta]|uniref:Uncharacterized protein n=1 Tax=Xylaria curta TaxID=42375 RepID=A0ACC1NLL0_9PEZI|nr:hypothetical protein NUW58_g7020 [Xylaria curta]